MKLDLDMISRATNGKPGAMQNILQYYDHYIDALSAYEFEDENGFTQRQN